MSVKRYEWVSCDEHACHCDVVESAEGDMVDYEDYAALEARFAALAAEMAWLKKFCKDAAFDADYEAELGMERGGFTDALNDIKTPATDVFLAEVRASELDSLAGVAETMMVKFANQGASEIPEAKGWEITHRQASQRAAQLRKGVQS